MSHTGWFLVELYYMMKGFGKRKIGKIVNTFLSFIIFFFSLFLLGQNAVIVSILLIFLSLLIIKNGYFCVKNLLSWENNIPIMEKMFGVVSFLIPENSIILIFMVHFPFASPVM